MSAGGNPWTSKKKAFSLLATISTPSLIWDLTLFYVLANTILCIFESKSNQDMKIIPFQNLICQAKEPQKAAMLTKILWWNCSNCLTQLCHFYEKVCKRKCLSWGGNWKKKWGPLSWFIFDTFQHNYTTPPPPSTHYSGCDGGENMGQQLLQLF